MRYIDSGSRDPNDALGTWLEKHLLHSQDIIALRWQTGFFNVPPLGYFQAVFKHLRSCDGEFQLLIGSNKGVTQRDDLEALLELAAPLGPRRQIGIVHFNSGLFHPKVIQFSREDGSQAAYVGSANLTRSGVESLHVEAGIILDTRSGDNSRVIRQISSSIDRWFTEEPQGLFLVEGVEDLRRLVASGILNKSEPSATEGTGEQDGDSGSLSPLVSSPALGGPSSVNAASGKSPAVAEWSKQLTRSDAQRKRSGHQRGSITLVAAGHPVDTQTFFRYEFFADADWEQTTTQTGHAIEEAIISFRTIFLGKDLGVLKMKVSYDSSREADQSNYTSLLHLGPLSSRFSKEDLTRRTLRIRQDSEGHFTLLVE